MHDHQTTITPTRPTAPAWVLVVGAVCLLMALLLTAFGPGHLDPVSTSSAGSDARTVSAGATATATAGDSSGN